MDDAGSWFLALAASSCFSTLACVVAAGAAVYGAVRAQKSEVATQGWRRPMEIVCCGRR